MRQQFLRTALLLLAGAAGSAACHLLSDPDASNVKSLIVAGTPPVIGESSPFAAMAVHPDGTSTTVTADATWRSSNTAVATVSTNGTVTAKNHGSVEISATYGGARGAFAFDVAAEASLTLSGTITDSATKAGIAGATIVVKDVSNNTRAATTTGTGGTQTLAITGSGAGAFGLTQFLPSSYLRFAVDGDGDGVVSLYDADDAIASTANYLRGNGWRPGISYTDQRRVIWTYNHSDAYIDTVLRLADVLE